MDKSEKQLMLNEIANWRNSRLLPAEYCDFLTNLYSEGEMQLPEPNHAINNTVRQIGARFQWRSLIIPLMTTLLLLLFVLHFTSFPNWMQMALLLVLSSLFYCLGFVFFSRHTLRLVFLCAGCLTAACGGYSFAVTMEYLDSPAWCLSIFVVVMMLWIVIGAIGNSRMIVAAGWTGIAILYEYALLYGKNVQFNAYALNHAYWLLFAGIAFLIAVWLSRAKQYTAAVWAVFGAGSLLVPEFLYLFSGEHPYFLLDITAFLKVALLVSLLIVFRQEIQKWSNSLYGYKM